MKPRVLWQALITFALLVPIITISWWTTSVSGPIEYHVLARFVPEPIAYILIFPGWFLALWIWGYSSGPSTASEVFIVAVNSTFYTTAIVWLIGKLFGKHKKASPKIPA